MSGFLGIVVLILKGIFVGFGAILPGLSGGSLCVAFGMYEPVINMLSSPIIELKQNGKKLVFFIFGAALGFVGLSGLAGFLMEKNAFAVICVSAGFILGTFPRLLADAGLYVKKPSYIPLISGFVTVMALLIVLKFCGGVQVSPDFFGFFLCGVLWALSFIVPGLCSSSFILFIGLYEQMEKGIATLDMHTVIPLGLGAIVCLLLLSKPVGNAYKKWRTPLSYAIIGVMLAGTAGVFFSPEMPSGALADAGDVVSAFLYVALGTVSSYFMSKII